MEYTHGGDVYRNEIEYDFSININPLGMPLASIRAAHEGIVLSGRYPDYRGEKLCHAIAEYENVKKENVILGNGAAELIYTLCYALVPKRGLMPAPTFGEYARALRATGGDAIYYDLRESEEFVLGTDFLDCIGTDVDIVFLCNPNNPTGKLIDSKMMKQIIQRCREYGVYLCVDECFLPFLQEESEYTAVSYLSEYDRMIVLRAFTKIYGMAGLRLGYALSGNVSLLERMGRKTQPWTTSIPAQMAGVEALKDTEFLVKTRELITTEREYLKHGLNDGLVNRVYDSTANYILFRADKELYDKMLDSGVLIRRCGDFRGLTDEYYRIGVRSHSENQELLRRMGSQGGKLCHAQL